MRIFRFITVILIMIALCGCSNKSFVLSNTYVYGQDSQINFINCALSGTMAQTLDGYYFLTGPEMGFLYCFDFTKKQAVPACGKPDCMHAGELDPAKIVKCNAFLGLQPEYLEYYEGSLYYVLCELSGNGEAVYTLNKLSPDGTKHQRMSVFKDIPTNVQIHRGYVYYTASEPASGTDGSEKGAVYTYKLCRLRLGEGGANPEILDSGEKVDGLINRMICYGTGVFYTVHYYTDASMEDRVGYVNRYDIETKTVGRVLDVDSPWFTIFNGKIVYMKINSGTFISDMDGKNEIKVCDQYGIYSADGDDLYIDDVLYHKADRKLTIVGKDWHVAGTVSLKGLIEMPLGCTQDGYFIPDNRQSNEFGPINSIYCVSPGDTAPKLFFQFVPKAKEVGVITGK